MEARTKHKIALAGGAVAVCGITYFILTTQGDNADASPMTMGGGGLGGFGDLFRKLLGSGGGLGALDMAGKLPSLGDLPMPPTGQLGPDIGDVGINSTAPNPDTSTTNSVQQFKQALVDFFTPPQVQGPSAAAPSDTMMNMDPAPTYDNGLIMPAGTVVQSPNGYVTLAQDQTLTPLPGSAGHFASDSYGNTYETSVPASPSNWNPALGHDPSNPYDTN